VPHPRGRGIGSGYAAPAVLVDVVAGTVLERVVGPGPLAAWSNHHQALFDWLVRAAGRPARTTGGPDQVAPTAGQSG